VPPALQRCRRAGGRRGSRASRRAATWFVSHTWNNAFPDTIDSIFAFFEGRADAADARLWLDVFVDSQHASEGACKTPQWYMTTFKSSIARIGSLLLVVDAWDNPAPLKRGTLPLTRSRVRERLRLTLLTCAQVRAGAACDCREEGGGRGAV
jgi:hypothetical protein